MIADRMLRSTRSSAPDRDVIGGHWSIDRRRSRIRASLATIAAVKNVEGTVDVSDTALTIAAVFDVEHTTPQATFPSGTLRARTILWSGEDGLAMGEISLEGMTRTSAFDVVVRGYSADPFGRERARIAAETELVSDGEALTPRRGRLRLELELARDAEPEWLR